MAKISLDKVTDTRQKASVTAAEEETLAAEKKAVKKLQLVKKVDGFRKGKIPENIIKKRFLAEVETDTLNNLIHDLIPEISAKSEQSIYRIVNVQNYSKDKNTYKFDIIFDLMPFIKNIKTKNAIILDNIPQIQDNDIDEEIKQIQKAGARTEAKAGDACAEKGDLLTFNYEIWMDGVPQGEEQKDVKLVLGENNFDEELEEKVIKEKVKQGAELSIQKKFKKNEQDKEERPYEIHIKIEKVEKIIYPEVNDELAKAYSPDYNNVSELKEGLKDAMQKQFARKNLTNEIAKVYDILEAQNEFLFPEGYLEEKLLDFLEEYKVDPTVLPEEQKKEYREAIEKRYRRVVLNESLVKETVKHFNKEELEKEFEVFVKSEFEDKVAEYAIYANREKKNDETLNRINLFFQNKLIYDYFKKNKLVKKGKKLLYKEFMKEEKKPV